MSFRYVIADDAPFVREILKTHLDELGGYCVGEADDGEIAVDICRKLNPDLIVLDLVMPRKNGLEVIRELRIENDQMRIILCSTLDQHSGLEQDIKKYKIQFLAKPFSKDQIFHLISTNHLKHGELNE